MINEPLRADFKARTAENTLFLLLRRVRPRLAPAPFYLASLETERLAFRSPQVLSNFPRLSRLRGVRPYRRDDRDCRLQAQTRLRLSWAISQTCVCGSGLEPRPSVTLRSAPIPGRPTEAHVSLVGQTARQLNAHRIPLRANRDSRD